MTAVEIIEMIKALPPIERTRVYARVKDLEAKDVEAPKIRYVSDEKFDEAAAEIFDRHSELFRRLAEYEREERK